MNHRIVGIACAILAALAAAMPRPAPASDFAAMAPNDAYVLLSVGNVDEFVAAYQKNSYGRFWMDPEVQSFIRPGKEKLDARLNETFGEYGVDWPTLRTLFPGQIAIWLESLEPYKPNEYGLVLAANRVDSPDKYRDLVETALQRHVSQTLETAQDRVGDVNVFINRWDVNEGLSEQEIAAQGEFAQYSMHSLSFAFPEGLFMLALDGDESIQRALRRRENGESLASAPGFRPLASSFAGPQLRLFINWQPFLGAFLFPSLEEQAEVGAPDLTPLGIRDLRDLGYWSIADENSSRVWMKLRVADEPQGVVRGLLSQRPLDEATLRAAPPEPLSLFAMGFDINAAAQDMLRAAGAMSPSFALGWGAIEASAQQLAGMSVERDILPALGDQVFSFTTPSADPAAPLIYTIGVKLARAETIDSLMAAVMAQEGMEAAISKTEFQGASIYAIEADPAMELEMMTPQFASTGQWFLMSFDGALLRDTIRRLSGQDARTFPAAEALRKAPNVEGPAQLVAFNMQDYGGQADMLLESLSEANMMLGLVSGGSIMLSEWLDFTAMPSPETMRRYWGVDESYVFRQPDGLLLINEKPNELP